jgi:uncharacterized protein (TIGR00369 family)
MDRMEPSLDKIAWPGVPFPVPPGLALDPVQIMRHGVRLPAHQVLGTRMLALERDGVTLAVDWREDLVGDPESGALGGGVVTSLLDHATGLSTLTRMAGGGEGRPGGTISLRIDYLKPSTRGRALLVDARCYRLTRQAAFVRGTAYHAERPDDAVAYAAGVYDIVRGAEYEALEDVPDIAPQGRPAAPLGEPFPELVKRAQAAGDLSMIARAIPYFAFLGLNVREENGDMVTVLPAWQQHVANLYRGLLHGGVIGALLEATALLKLFAHDTVHVAKTICFTTDFLRGATLTDLHARAIVVRMGRRIANVRCEAWQDDPSKLVATAHGNFLLA